MSAVQLQQVLFSTLPQLSENQLLKLLKYARALLAVPKSQGAKNPVQTKVREVRVFLDDSFDIDQEEVYVETLFKKSFTAQANIEAVEKYQPTIVLA